MTTPDINIDVNIDRYLPKTVVFYRNTETARMERLFPKVSGQETNLRLSDQGTYLVRIMWDGNQPLTVRARTWLAGIAGTPYDKIITVIPPAPTNGQNTVMVEVPSEGNGTGAAPTFMYFELSAGATVPAAARCAVTYYLTP